MAPIEIRPITAAGVPGGPVQPGPAGEGVPEGMVRPQFRFDANRDGPWPRSPQELRGKSNTLLEVATEIYLETVAAGKDAPITGRRSYVYGVWTAAHWTLGALPKAPMSSEPVPVTDAAVAREAQIAQFLLAEGDQVTGAFAGGVLAWLSWITGVTSFVPWPD